MAGTASFVEKNGTVTFVAKLAGLTPGVHAIHIHEKSDCSAADGSSAGGHWNPTFKKHGKLGEGEAHKGDIGNFTADEKGNGTMGKLMKDETMYNNFSKASSELELLLQDLRLNPTRYVNVSLFGKKNKPYVAPVNDTIKK